MGEMAPGNGSFDAGDAGLESLVLRSKQGDAGAVRDLLERASTLSLRTALGLVGSRDLASDIAQETAVDVIKGLGKLEKPSAFDAWVHRITARRAARALRRQALLRQTELPIAVAEDLPSGDGALERVSDRTVVAAAIAELPVKQRLAIAFRYVHDMSDADIAAALQCREGTVHALLSRARATLRRSECVQGLRPTSLSPEFE